MPSVPVQLYRRPMRDSLALQWSGLACLRGGCSHGDGGASHTPRGIGRLVARGHGRSARGRHRLPEAQPLLRALHAAPGTLGGRDRLAPAPSVGCARFACSGRVVRLADRGLFRAPRRPACHRCGPTTARYTRGRYSGGRRPAGPRARHTLRLGRRQPHLDPQRPQLHPRRVRRHLRRLVGRHGHRGYSSPRTTKVCLASKRNGVRALSPSGPGTRAEREFGARRTASAVPVRGPRERPRLPLGLPIPVPSRPARARTAKRSLCEAGTTCSTAARSSPTTHARRSSTWWPGFGSASNGGPA